MIDRNGLIELINKHKFIFFGEMHGTKSIPDIVTQIIKKVKGKKVLCVELPKQADDELLRYLEGKENNFLKSIYTKDALKDKRLSEHILKMYKELHKTSVNIMCLENYQNKNIKERDKEMANRFIEIVTNLKADKYFLYVGNLHLLDKSRYLLIFKIQPIMLFLSDYIRQNALIIQFSKAKKESINFDRKGNVLFRFKEN